MSPASILFFQAILNLFLQVQNTGNLPQIVPPIVTEAPLIKVPEVGTTTTITATSSSTTTSSARTELVKVPPTIVEVKPIVLSKDSTSVDNLIVVNKQNPLSSSYTPADLVYIGNGRKLKMHASNALEKLLHSAAGDNITLKVLSGYRSYADQEAVYMGWVQKDGKEKADTYSARPGYSEHQTGLAVDLGSTNSACNLEICFADTEAGKWLAAHAHEFGYIIRFPENKVNITGYQYEPWHIRYVGVEIAREIYLQEKSLEEYLGFPPALNY